MGQGQSTPVAPPPEVPAEIRAPTVDPNVVAQDPTKGLTSGAGAGADKDVLNVSVLERMVSAANELKTSEFASDLINLMKEQETSWQKRFDAERQQSAAVAEQEKQRLEQIRQEEMRKTMQYQSEQQAKSKQYEDELARKRYEDQLQMQAQAAERERQQQMQAVAAQEQERRRTMQYQAELDRETNVEKAKAEGLARARQERENRDIRDAQLLVEAAEKRETTLQAVREAGRVIGTGITDYLQDPEKMAATVGIATALALGVYSMKTGSAVAGQYLTARLMRPPLVRDTSRKPILLNPVQWLKQAFSKPSEDVLGGIVLEKSLQHQLRDITIATARTRANKSNYRNLMLYGPPGTGKTLFAMKLAKQTGLDYAVLAGGDIAPLGSAAVNEIHKVFDWGESRSRGLILFVDEADAFLRRRGSDKQGEMSENLRNALSTFLYRTGTPSNKTMLVFATNELEMFDRAVIDRVDEVVEFELPGEEERTSLLKMYFNEAVLDSGRGIQVAEDVDIENWSGVSKQLDGFSGRQIMKLCNAWQAAAYASVNNTLTKEMMKTALDRLQGQQKVKESWDNAATKSS